MKYACTILVLFGSAIACTHQSSEPETARKIVVPPPGAAHDDERAPTLDARDATERACMRSCSDTARSCSANCGAPGLVTGGLNLTTGELFDPGRQVECESACDWSVDVCRDRCAAIGREGDADVVTPSR